MLAYTDVGIRSYSWIHDRLLLLPLAIKNSLCCPRRNPGDWEGRVVLSDTSSMCVWGSARARFTISLFSLFTAMKPFSSRSSDSAFIDMLHFLFCICFMFYYVLQGTRLVGFLFWIPNTNATIPVASWVAVPLRFALDGDISLSRAFGNYYD